MLAKVKNLNPIVSGLVGMVLLISSACGGAPEAPAEQVSGEPPAPSITATVPAFEVEPETVVETVEEPVEETAAEEVVVIEVYEEAEEEAMAEASGGAFESDQSQDYFPAAPTESPASTPGAAVPAATPAISQRAESLYFESEGVNPFVDTEDDHLSTFAMDVDTASYSVARRYLDQGSFPPRDAIRVEEFINYFDLDYPGPIKDHEAFAIHMEGAPAPFGSRSTHLLKIGLQGKDISLEERKDAVLTFVIDVSGSMDREDRLGLVKQSLRLLVDELRPTDRVGIVVYGSYADVILEPTSANNRELIMWAIDRLQPGGSTNAEDGLQLGYQMAAHFYRDEAVNRVILLSDGVANVGATGPDAILSVIRNQVEKGVTLSTVGVGMGDYNDALMEQLANDGNGNYAYVATLEDAHRIFVENLTGTLQVIAKDAKIQVDFNPDVVRSYRLLGYENRAVADRDFRNDTVDAGEVGAGHSVTALYEVKFQDGIAPDAADLALITFVRYEDIDTDRVVEVAKAMARQDFYSSPGQTSPEFRFIAAVAEYAELLRGSYWAREGNFTDVQLLTLTAVQDLGYNNDVVEFMGLLNDAIALNGEGGS